MHGVPSGSVPFGKVDTQCQREAIHGQAGATGETADAQDAINRSDFFQKNSREALSPLGEPSGLPGGSLLSPLGFPQGVHDGRPQELLWADPKDLSERPAGTPRGYPAGQLNGYTQLSCYSTLHDRICLSPDLSLCPPRDYGGAGHWTRSTG